MYLDQAGQYQRQRLGRREAGRGPRTHLDYNTLLPGKSSLFISRYVLCLSFCFFKDLSIYLSICPYIYLHDCSAFSHSLAKIRLFFL